MQKIKEWTWIQWVHTDLILVKAAVDMSKKVSNKSFKEPVSKTSNGSRVASRASKTDIFSDDDEELLSVSQRPSASSLILSKSKRLSSSSKLGQTSRSSRMDRVSFSSTINNLLENSYISITIVNLCVGIDFAPLRYAH